MKIIDALNCAIKELEKANVENNKYEARAFLAHILGRPNEWIMIHINDEITKQDTVILEQYVERRIGGEPFQYIIGNCGFMGLDFIVNKNVLVPRADTEVWVERVIELAKETKASSILDLCTGSGCIAITLKKMLKDVLVYASDVSKEALKVASENAVRNDVEVKFICSNLFERFPADKFDIIVSNPPYIPREEIKKLARDVQNEPLLALDGGEDGLDFYRKIVKESKSFINENGYLVFEFGYDQVNQVKDILEGNGFYICEIIKDYSGNTRAIISKKGVKE